MAGGARMQVAGSDLVADRRGAAAALELLKPITWFAPMWAFGCGVISIAQPVAWWVVLLGVLLAGPMVCGTSQAVNDWFDRHVDAINEPGRPIPSGRLPGRSGLWIALAWTTASLCVAAVLGRLVFDAAMIGLAMAWAYSAPPLRLKENGWVGNLACGACYEGLPWFTGATLVAGGWPGGHVMAVLALYSIGAHGIMTLNDFKSVEGDRQMGVDSLPVLLGPERAARLACLVMGAPQAIVVALLLSWGRPWFALLVGVLMAVQAALMLRFLREPRRLAPWYNGTGTLGFVLGMLAVAFALRGGA
jgi:chlorophyll synthase